VINFHLDRPAAIIAQRLNSLQTSAAQTVHLRHVRVTACEETSACRAIFMTSVQYHSAPAMVRTDEATVAFV
jgi:hypothetical protein